LAGFFKILDRAFGLGVMARPGGELAITHFAHLPAHRLFGDGDTKLLEHPLAKIDDPPPHNAMDTRHRAIVDHARESGAVLVFEQRRLAGRFAINQAIWAMRVEPQHPVSDNLEPNPADLGRFAPRSAIVDRRQSEKPARLRTIFRAFRDSPKSYRIKIIPKPNRCRHDEHPRVRHVESNFP
jgi:hypothetical protein